MPVCPVCSREAPGDARFCPSCGAALTAEQPREERKVVTVVFADLVGFTSRAEQLDPEDVRAVLGPYWERLRTELERRGGTVEKFIGDAVMALFGAPVAHEDDPLRAVGAALAIRDWAREEPDVQVRIAVNTGEALVLLGARPTEGEGMATGDVVNTAARLQTAAPVNGVLVGEATYRATRDVIEYAEHEPVVAKGKAEPVRVWEALQTRSRYGVDVEQQAYLPLVGRVRELQAIVGAFERARDEREPQLVTLVGVPGIGKSRLVAELFAHLGESAELVRWRQGRALPYGDGVSFWPLVEMVKAQAGIQENDDAETADSKLAESVGALVDPDDHAWVLDHLRPLLGLAPAAATHGESFPAWRRYFEGLAEQRPLVLVFEDLHWADEGLLDFVDHLVDWTTGVPIFVLGTARPELLDHRPGWGGGKLNASTIALPPLSDVEAAQIIEAVVPQSGLPDGTRRELLERAGGNPLYAEQFARLYVERGETHDLPLPETVHGIVAARLDALSAEEKRIAQDAAVIGKVFWAGAVTHLTGFDADTVATALHSLERKGLVRRERRSAVGGDEQYAFRHVLVRDVAYGTIPRASRAERHSQAAAWLEQLGRASDHAELLAHHFSVALELQPHDAQLADRALAALRRAAERSLALHAYVTALRLTARALDLAPDDPFLTAAHARSRFRVEGDRSELSSAIDTLEAAGHLEEAADLAALAANAAWRAGRRDEAEAIVARGEALLAGRPPSPALAALAAEHARLQALTGREDATDAANQALRLAEEVGLDELRASALGTLGIVRMHGGSVGEAAELLERAIEVAPRGSPEIARAATNRSLAAYQDGDTPTAEAWVERALEAVLEAGDRPNRIWAEFGLVNLRYYSGGRWDEALARMSAMLEEIEAIGGHYFHASLLLQRAAILAARDNVEAAQADLSAALAIAAPGGDLQYTMPMHAEVARVWLLLGEDERAHERAHEMLQVLESTELHTTPAPHADYVVTWARCGVGERVLARFAPLAPTQRIVAARLVYSGRTLEAAEMYATMTPAEEAAARLLAAEQLAAAGRSAEADAQAQRALAFYRAVGATRIVRQAELLLAVAS